MTTVDKQIGPNVKKLIIHKMSLIAIPVGSGDRSLELGIQAITNMKPVYQEARDWVEAAIALVRVAPDCPYTTDEEIAGAILQGVDNRRRSTLATVRDATNRNED